MLVHSLIQRITYAKTKSDAVAKVDGTFKADKKQRAKAAAATKGAMAAAVPLAGGRDWLHVAACGRANHLIHLPYLLRARRCWSKAPARASSRGGAGTCASGECSGVARGKALSSHCCAADARSTTCKQARSEAHVHPRMWHACPRARMHVRCHQRRARVSLLQAFAPGAAAPAAAQTAAPPNKILFVQNLPENSNDQMLSMLFQQ